jgi:hypothetical protein
MTNQEILALLAKAAITTGAGGLLPETKAKEFIDLVVDQSDFLKAIQVIQMTSNKHTLSTIEIAARNMLAAEEGVAPSTPTGVTIRARSLEYKESIVPFDVTYSFIEENIEGGGINQKLNQMFAKSFANDLLDLAINGDESLAETITDAGSDGKDDTTGLTQNDHTFLRQNYGWLALARADSLVHKVTIPAEITSYRTELRRTLQAMPNKWKLNLRDLMFLVSPVFDEAYRDEIAERNTVLGDKAVIEGNMIPYAGIPVKALAHFPDDKIMLVNPKNLGVGIGRAMKLESQNQARKRVIEYTITAKSDFNYAVSDAIVLSEK